MPPWFSDGTDDGVVTRGVAEAVGRVGPGEGIDVLPARVHDLRFFVQRTFLAEDRRSSAGIGG